MKEKNIEKKYHDTFEKFKQYSQENIGFWYARDLQIILEYSSWDKFKRVIQKAIVVCETAGQLSNDHFSQVGKMVGLGS
ncbi:hypothetical protein K8S19_07095 [bacterium]|nr:hypothetical protein [bacterium]